MKKSLACKLGLHDYEIIQASFCGEVADWVCINCGKVFPNLTNAKKKQKERDDKAARIWNEYAEKHGLQKVKEKIHFDK